MNNTRTLDSPTDLTYDCQNQTCDNPRGRGNGIDLPDSEFPQRSEVQQYGLDAEICLMCQRRQ